MKPLLRAQWRLVHWRFVVFTLLGALLPPYLTALGSNESLAVGTTVWPAFLAASLPARLLARPAAESDSQYWTAVPLSRLHWFGLRLLLMFGLLATSLGLEWVAWHSSIGSGIFDWIFDPKGMHGYADSILVSGADGSFRPTYLPPDFPRTLALSLLVLSATTYFASSLERASAAWQAGLPGFCFGFFGFGYLTHGMWSTRAWILWSGTVAIVVLSLTCALLLQRQRGICAADRGEALLGRGSRSTTALHLIGQCCFVVAPLVLILTSGGDISPRPALTQAELLALVLAALSICVLPGTLREVRSLGRGLRERAAVLILRTSLVGVPLWKVLRRGAPAVHCAGCGRRRLARLVDCPECHARSTRSIERSGPRRFLLPSDPWGVAIISFGGFVVIAMLLSWIPRTRTLEWRLEAHIPGVELRTDGSEVQGTELTGLLPGDGTSISKKRDWLLVGARIPHPSPFTSEDLRTAAAEYARSDPGPGLSRYGMDSFVPQDLTFEVRAPGSEVWIRSFASTLQVDLLTERCVTVLELEFPTHVENARRLIDAALGGGAGEQQIADTPALGEPFLVVMIREMGTRVPNRFSPEQAPRTNGIVGRMAMGRHMHTLLDSIVRAEIDADARSGRSRPDQLLRQLDDRRQRFEPGAFRTGALSPPLDLALYYRPLRELSWVATADDLNDEIMGGDAFAAIAAGLSAAPANFESCARLAQASMDASGRASGEEAGACRLRLLCATWAMLRIDAPRAASWILDRLSGRPFDSTDGLLILLGFSGRADVESRLNSLAPALIARDRGFTDDAIERCMALLHAGAMPEEYWLGW